MARNGWIGVDLDGTLAYYDGWKGHTHIGAPIPLMVARVKQWLSEGKRVKIFTARISDPSPEQREDVRLAIYEWCVEHIGEPLAVTCVKDSKMIALWDDRAVAVETNTGQVKVSYGT